MKLFQLQNVLAIIPKLENICKVFAISDGCTLTQGLFGGLKVDYGIRVN